MMKKNGFISISIIYSFFIIFMLLLFLVMSSYVNTRIRLNIYKTDIKKTYAVTDESLLDFIKNAGNDNIYEEKNGTTVKSYRYIGSSPNNYIVFNGEKWRIIGAICTNTACTRANIKIVRNTSFKYAYDCKKDGVGFSKPETKRGYYDWRISQLMMMLNPIDYKYTNYVTDGTYGIKDADNVLIYPFMGAYFNDDLPLYKLGATDANGFPIPDTIPNNTKCSETVSSNCLKILSPTAQDWIISRSSIHTRIDFSKSGTDDFDIYAAETGGNLNWTGKVTLISAGDICLASKEQRENCLKNKSMPTDSWLMTAAGNGWLFDTTTSGKVLYSDSSKFTETDNLCAERIIKPVVYLQNGLKIYGNNDGSVNKPLIIGE